MTGSIAVAQGGSGTNDYEKLINKPLVFDSSANFPPVGHAERLYIATNVNKIYYWTGITYADISGSGGGGSGTDGKSPYIGENGNWFEYNDVLQAWIDTGVRAEGKDGLNGADGKDGIDGIDGKSAYEIAVENGFIGTESEWLESLKGADGTDGINGTDGSDGEDGKSAYQVWLDNGNTGTELEFLASLKGEKGDTGLQGLKGDKGDKGDTGDKGDKGEDGYTPVKGVDYFTPADIESLGIANKADTTYVDGLVTDINTELATKSTKPTIITNLSATTRTVTLENNTEYRYGTLTSLTITWTTANADIHSAIAFTGGTGVTFSITSGVKLVGTDVTDGVFAPVKGKRYNLGFEYDGVNRTVYVSGVE